MKKILLLAGEESGVIYAARIAAELRRLNPQVEIRGYADYGFKTEDLAVMGVVQVLRKLRYFLRVKRTMEQAIDEWRPDTLCTVDYPGLNLKLAAYARARGIRAVHVVCPQVWAWHQSRIPSIEQSLDKICCFFPFEPKIFREGLGEFVGHPLVEDMMRERAELADKKDPGQEAGRKLLAVLPGSRLGEIRHHMPKLVEVMEILLKEISGLEIVLPAANEKAERAIRPYLESSQSVRERARLQVGGARELLREATAAVVASGTATLEAAIVGCPTVLVYHVDLIFEIICRISLKGVKHIGLANIVAEKAGAECPMPELIQQDFTVSNILKHLRPWLTDATSNEAARAALDRATRLLQSEGGSIARIARILL